MSRGIMYHITKGRAGSDKMDACDFEDYLGALNINSVENMPEDASGSALTRLSTALSQAGFCILADRIDANMEAAAFRIDTNVPQKALDDAKTNWFGWRFNTLRDELQDYNRRAFACDPDFASRLRNLIDMTYDDTVYTDNGAGPVIYTMDRFIRIMEPNTVYYVSMNTVLMH